MSCVPSRQRPCPVGRALSGWGGALRRQTRFTTLQELELDLERGNQIGIAPAGTGEYYFTATLRIRTLSDEEMEDLERFLQGNPTPEERERGSVLGRAARRLLLRFGGLPFEELEAESEAAPVPVTSRGKGNRRRP